MTSTANATIRSTLSGSVTRPRRSTNHPRMCGEHRSGYCEYPLVRGSSPHVRGAQNQRIPGRGLRGIIPACAGSTVHRITKVIAVTGSSPHVRGAPVEFNRNPDVHGIIPACAGSTSRVRLPLMTTRGSSPHVRGAR